MQNYIDLAAKNGFILLDSGKCQFCGSDTVRGIHECLEVFNLGFNEADFARVENHIFRFLIVDAHALQHPEIHGRWSNHFHLVRLHLIFEYNIKWTYELSPKLSDYVNRYKVQRQNEYLIPPDILQRGVITSSDIIKQSTNESICKAIIQKWALEVYKKWHHSHCIVDTIAKGFLNRK